MRTIYIVAICVTLIVMSSAFTEATPHTAKAKQPAIRFQDKDPQKQLQPAVASKTAKFATVGKTDPLYKNALDAHDLVKALKMVGDTGAFKGTVSKLFEERDGDIVVFDFDPNFRTALTAVLKNPDFPKFPDVKTLVGKEIIISGKFIDFHGKAQIVLTDPEQIKLVK